MNRKNRKMLIVGAAVLCAVWFSGCSSPLEGPGVKPEAPGAPVLKAGKASFHVQWEETSLAETYQVYLSLDETATVPIKTDVTGNSVTLDGLVNETTYYVWVQAVNRMGKSPLSDVAKKTLTLEPPVITALTAGNGSMTVTWDAFGMADSYNVYYDTSATLPASPYQSNITGNSVTISGLINDTTYYVWVEAVNSGGAKMSEAGSITLTLQPPVPVLTPGNGSISISWTADPFADSYNVYYATSATLPASPHQTGITGNSVTITGLVIGTTYYVWVEAINTGGTKISEAKNITLSLTAPEPVLQGGDSHIIITWEPVTFADSYNVYYSTSTTPPANPYQSGITGTFLTINGLTNNTTYYVWVEAVNSGGTMMSDVKSITPPFIQEYTVSSVSGFTLAVGTINALSTAGSYRITLAGNITAGNVSFSETSAEKIIIIRGDTVPRTITGGASTSNIAVNNGNTLILENNISLQDYNEVRVNEGTLVMRTGSRIAAGDVEVQNGGTFTMHDGTISVPFVWVVDSSFTIYDGTIDGSVSITGNGSTFEMSGGNINGNTMSDNSSVRVYGTGSTFTMSGGTISGNHTSNWGNFGGGVSVTGNDNIFTMSGGEISGNSAAWGGGGVSVGFYGTFMMSGGEISGNEGYRGGGVYVREAGTFMMSGGTINGNTAGLSGGGVYIENRSTFTMSNGTISGNTATENGGGVFVDILDPQDSVRFIKSGGGTITNTNTATLGKVAYVYLSSSSYRQRNTAAGSGVNMDSNVNGSVGGWENP